MAIWHDEGSTGGTAMALGGHDGPALLGGDKCKRPHLLIASVILPTPACPAPLLSQPNLLTHNVIGIAVGSNSGVVNIYDRDSLILPSGDDELNVKERPEPAKTFMQLTVPVTTILFSPDGQLACLASVHKKDALRLVHTGSLSVYRNWPTEQTPLVWIPPYRFGNFLASAHKRIGPRHFSGLFKGHAACGRQRCRRCQIVGDTGLNREYNPFLDNSPPRRQNL